MRRVTLIAKTSMDTRMMVSVSSYFVVQRWNRCVYLVGLPILYTATTGRQVSFPTGCILFIAMIHSSLIQLRLIPFIISLIKVFSAIVSWKWRELPLADFFIRRLLNLRMLSI